MWDSSRDRQFEGGTGLPDDLAQITRLRAAVGGGPHPRHLGPEGRDTVGNRGGKQFGRGGQGRHHGGLVEPERPIAIEGAVDDGAVAKPVGGDHHRTGNLELLLQRGGHAATSREASSASAARHGSEGATTSPITSNAGPSPVSAASAARSARR